jgi:hypothetical protein
MSGDAAPALVNGLAKLSNAHRTEVETALEERWGASNELEYRDWNYSRWNAARVVRQHINNSASN